jgi:hypothetical protein
LGRPSLASLIGYVDLTKAAQIVNNRAIKPFELVIVGSADVSDCGHSNLYACSLLFRTPPESSCETANFGFISIVVLQKGVLVCRQIVRLTTVAKRPTWT